MTLPSALDPTVAPKGAHVAQLFVQFTPYKLAGGEAWDEESKQAFANTGDVLSRSFPQRKKIHIQFARESKSPRDWILFQIKFLSDGTIWRFGPNGPAEL